MAKGDLVGHPIISAILDLVIVTSNQVAFVEKIEEKMGIHGNATCAMSFGARGPAKGWLIGAEGQGMSIMFHMMNEARLEVGVQGLSGAAAAYGNALSYAKGRIQGVSIDDYGKAGATSVPIIEHPDVRRMLMWQKVHVEGLRLLIYDVALAIDRWHAAEHAENPDKDTIRGLKGYVELMTPIVKSYASDKGFDATVSSMQTFGGYGFVGEYPVEQIARDTKIASIYEGTNGIQAMDLVGRKMARKGGMAFMQTLNWLNHKINAVTESASFAAEGALLGKARDRLGACAMHLSQVGMSGDQEGAVSHAYDMLMLFGDVVIGALLGDQALLAEGKLDALAADAGVDLGNADARREFLRGNPDALFYAGKLDNLRFYAHQHLPRTAALKHMITATDRTVMEAVF